MSEFKATGSKRAGLFTSKNDLSGEPDPFDELEGENLADEEDEAKEVASQLTLIRKKHDKIKENNSKKKQHLERLKKELDKANSVANIAESDSKQLHNKIEQLKISLEQAKKLHEEENKSYYWFGFLSDKNEKLDMALKCVTNIFPHYASIHFFSVDSPRIPRREGYKRMNCNNFLYEIRALGVETRRSSSDTDIDSNSSDDSPRSSSSDFRKQKSESDFLCKLSVTQDIEPELAKKICGEFSEETTRIKKSLSVLKEVAEKGLTDCAESKNYNSLYESLQRKSLKFRRRHSKVV